MQVMSGPIIRAFKPSLTAYEAAMKTWKATVPRQMLPTKTAHGTWRSAEWSARKVAKIRKTVLLAGHEWKWDKPTKPYATPLACRARPLRLCCVLTVCVCWLACRRPLVVMKGRGRELDSAERYEQLADCWKRGAAF